VAQILIRKREHFAEAVKPAQWSDFKWSGRPLRGDVVECRPNGYWRIEGFLAGTHGWNWDAFALIQITNLSLQQVALYQGGYWDDPAAPTKWFKNRYRLPDWNVSIPWIKTPITVDGVTYEQWHYIRANIHAIVTPQDKAVV
jgi:hypothetical protein